MCVHVGKMQLIKCVARYSRRVRCKMEWMKASGRCVNRCSCFSFVFINVNRCFFRFPLQFCHLFVVSTPVFYQKFHSKRASEHRVHAHRHIHMLWMRYAVSSKTVRKYSAFYTLYVIFTPLNLRIRVSGRLFMCLDDG